MNTTTAAPASVKPFESARRVNQSLTAAAEKRALRWMAERAPRWLSSDQLTLLGFAAQIGAGVFYGLARYHSLALLAVVACIILNWFGDSMDGTLARVRNQQRPRYGFYVDHVVDILGATAMMCGLGVSGFVHWPVAVAMLIGFLLLAAESYLATYTLSSFEMSQGMFGPTELRILLIIGNVALLRNPYATVLGHRVLLFDAGGAIAAAGMFAMVVVTAFRHTIELYKKERIG